MTEGTRKDVREQGRKENVDPPGIVMLGVALVALTLGLAQSGRESLALLAGVAAVLTFGGWLLARYIRTGR